MHAMSKNIAEQHIATHECKQQQAFFSPDVSYFGREHTRVAENQQNCHHNQVCKALIVVGEFEVEATFIRNCLRYHGFYVRGRHACMSTVNSTHVWKATSPDLRKRITPVAR